MELRNFISSQGLLRQRKRESHKIKWTREFLIRFTNLYLLNLNLLATAWHVAKLDLGNGEKI